MKTLSRCAAWLTLSFLSIAPTHAANSLPWEKDYPSALAKAKAEKRPLFLMLTATWCGPCKMLESRTLPATNVLAGLNDFIWVKAYEDEKLNQKFGLGGYPTLVFLDSTGERVLEKSSGYEAPGPFLRHIIAARREAKLPLTREMEELQSKLFVADENRVRKFIQENDTDGLLKYLAPVGNDALRENNFIVIKLRLPAGMNPQEVQAMAYSDLPVTESGILITVVPRDGSTAPLRVMAPGCKTLNVELSSDDKTPVALHELTLHKLTAKDAASFVGKVLRPDGQPVPQAIVRLCDWDVTRTDREGNFKFERVTPGTLLVRAEAPGGELQQEMTFGSGQGLKQDLMLKPVTTVGIRWAMQTKEGSQELEGDGVRTGEAYFSVEHSRFLLSRGAEVPQYYGSDFMLNGDWKELRQYIPEKQIAVLEKSNAGEPIFWLFDAGSWPNGLHEEKTSFDEIRSVNDGKPYDVKSYFKFLRGELVSKGKVYTVRCVRKDCYAKLEITDVTVVPKDDPKASTK